MAGSVAQHRHIWRSHKRQRTFRFGCSRIFRQPDDLCWRICRWKQTIWRGSYHGTLFCSDPSTFGQFPCSGRRSAR
jgi:hypothetical protein